MPKATVAAVLKPYPQMIIAKEMRSNSKFLRYVVPKCVRAKVFQNMTLRLNMPKLTRSLTWYVAMYMQ